MDGAGAAASLGKAVFGKQSSSTTSTSSTADEANATTTTTTTTNTATATPTSTAAAVSAKASLDDGADTVSEKNIDKSTSPSNDSPTTANPKEGKVVENDSEVAGPSGKSDAKE